MVNQKRLFHLDIFSHRLKIVALSLLALIVMVLPFLIFEELKPFIAVSLLIWGFIVVIIIWESENKKVLRRIKKEDNPNNLGTAMIWFDPFPLIDFFGAKNAIVPDTAEIWVTDSSCYLLPFYKYFGAIKFFDFPLLISKQKDECLVQNLNYLRGFASVASIQFNTKTTVFSITNAKSEYVDDFEIYLDRNYEDEFRKIGIVQTRKT